MSQTPALIGGRSLMAQRLRTQHHQREIDSGDILSCLADIVRCAAARLRESYNACSLVLSGMVRDAGLKVVLIGEGADELFGGYIGYRLDLERGGDNGESDLAALLEAQTRAHLWGDGALFCEKPYYALGETKQALYARPLAERHAGFDCLVVPPVDVTRLDARSIFHKRSYVDSSCAWRTICWSTPASASRSPTALNPATHFSTSA